LIVAAASSRAQAQAHALKSPDITAFPEIPLTKACAMAYSTAQVAHMAKLFFASDVDLASLVVTWQRLRR
jgi:hypothetical protein